MFKNKLLVFFIILSVVLGLSACKHPTETTTTATPTVSPTVEPTVIPTVTPTVSQTVVPTVQPTVVQTTNVPTVAPTAAPTPTPTVSTPVNPNAYYVNNTAELKKKISTLKPGDTLYLNDGVYQGDAITIDAKISGTADAPITIAAVNTGEVVFEGFTCFAIKGNYIVLAGIKFANGGPYYDTGAIRIYGDYVRLTNITIDGYNQRRIDNMTKLSYITVSPGAEFCEIDHCSFINKNTPGVLLKLERYGVPEPSYSYVHDNYFANFINPDPVLYPNELETIRTGDSSCSSYKSYILIERNIFENISSEPELVSVKSCNNIVRNNLIIKCTAAITLRSGRDSLVENNIILNDKITDSNGIRVFGIGHVIRNNYISGIANNTSTFYGGLVLHNGNNNVGTPNNNATGQTTTENVLIEGNSFVNNDVNLCLGDNRYEKAPGRLTLKDNFIYSPNANAIRQYDISIATSVTYENEYYYAPSLGLVSGVTPSGVTYSSDLASANITELANGLIESNVGAKNLVMLKVEDVTPKDFIVTSEIRNASYFESFYENWPTEQEEVKMPTLEDFAEPTVEYDDNFENWETTNAEQNTTLIPGEEVLKVTTITTPGINTISVGENGDYTKISFMVYVENISLAKCGLKIYSGGNGGEYEFARLKFEKGKIKFSTSATIKDDGNITPAYTTLDYKMSDRTWYKVDIVILNDSQNENTVVDIYINDTKINEYNLSVARYLGPVSHIGFFTDSNSEAGTNPYYYYVDKVSVTGKKEA